MSLIPQVELTGFGGFVLLVSALGMLWLLIYAPGAFFTGVIFILTAALIIYYGLYRGHRRGKGEVSRR